MNFINDVLRTSNKGEEFVQALAGILLKLTSDTSDEAIEECYLRLAINNDYEAFWEKVFQYADWNLRI